MAEFLTMQEAEDKFGKKGKTNAATTSDATSSAGTTKDSTYP